MMAPKWFSCSVCGLQRLGLEPVHEDNPCPMKVEEHEAYMALMETQRASYAGTGFATNDMVAMMKRMTKGMGIDLDDDD